MPNNILEISRAVDVSGRGEPIYSHTIQVSLRRVIVSRTVKVVLHTADFHFLHPVFYNMCSLFSSFVLTFHVHWILFFKLFLYCLFILVCHSKMLWPCSYVALFELILGRCKTNTRAFLNGTSLTTNRQHSQHWLNVFDFYFAAESLFCLYLFI